MADTRSDKQNIFQAENVVVHKTQPQGGDLPSIGRVHEERDVPINTLLRAMGYLVVAIVLVCVALWGMFEFFATQAEHRDPQLSPLAVDKPTPSPALQSNPALEMSRFRQKEDSAVGARVAGADGAAGMSVDDAMNAIAERGLPKFSASAVPTDSNSRRSSTDTSRAATSTNAPVNPARR